ncbi:hypothetical protein HY502_00925 [Candidatus Woesebacteria bacterium]|nr:hypothetical protein [Candidatus Woesebacteria bacterium]
MAEIRPARIIFQIIFGFFISFLILEVLFRLYYLVTNERFFGLSPKRTTLEWIDDEKVGRKLAPNQRGWFVSPQKEYFTWIETNKEGFRDVNHELEKPEGKKRLLILGDSFVENFQVPFEKTFFRQLEENFNQESVEILAMGLGDTGSAQQYFLLKEFGLKYKPNVVVQLFLTANDIRNNSKELNNNPDVPYLELDSSGNLKEVRPERNLQGFSAEIKETLKKSRLVEFVLWSRQLFLERATARDLGYPPDYHVYNQKYSPSYQSAWELTQKIILETKNMVEEAGGTYVLVVLANNEQVNKKAWEEILSVYPKITSADIDLEKPDKLLNEFCEQEKLECYFMLPYFREYLTQNPGSTTHFHYDGHLNETGTDLATKFLTEKLKDYFSTK